MSQKVIAITGISGVGKTTFVRKLAERIAFQHLTGGSLIARAQAGTTISRDALRLFDLDENQSLLVEGFMAARDQSAATVIFDGHAVIDGPSGLAKIPASVFEALNISLMVHLETDASAIQCNRTRDPDRMRPALSPTILQDHQIHSRRHAMAIARALNIDCLVIRTEEISRLEAYLRGDSRKDR